MNDTICALATATGGALGIIRVSGPQAFDAVSAICAVKCADCAPNTVHYTHIISPLPLEGSGVAQVVDEVMVSVFKAPRSYTGEDAVEISCHGSRYILNKVLELLIQNGCRMANPGEFTQRAYLNGKMDLSQAEAVADLIASTNKATHQMAMNQLRGNFSGELAQLREQLLKLTSLLELELDFSDHEDLEFANRDELLKLTKKIDNRITSKTNVGKSTLLNQLLKDDRAIVSNYHGTTRDTIEDTIDINGITFRFIDTAGIRQTVDEIEQIGIKRTYQAIDKARIVLWMIDSEPSTKEIEEIAQRTKGKSLITIINKIDKNVNDSLSSLSQLSSPIIRIAAKFGQGIDTLEQAIYTAANIPHLAETDIVVSNARHYDALVHAQESIQRVVMGMEQQIPGDLLAEDLRLTIDHLAEITGGQITPNEVLGNIFKNFCVGK